MNDYIAQGERAKEILISIADESIRIAYLMPGRTKVPRDDCECWDLMLRTTAGHVLTLVMEGVNIASLSTLVDFDGRRLIDRHNPLAVMDWLDGPTAAQLDQAVLDAVAQVIPTQ